MRTSTARRLVRLLILAIALLPAGCERMATVTPAPQLRRLPSPTADLASPSPAPARATSTPQPIATPTPSRPTMAFPPATAYPPTVPSPAPSSAAMVEAIQVNIAESQPVQVSVTVMGNLPDGCTRIVGSMVEIKEPVISLTVRTERPRDAICTLALAPFEMTFPLDVQRLGPGAYIVDVHGVREPLELTAPMLLLPGAQNVCAPAGEGLRSYTSISNRFCLLYPEQYYTFRPEAPLLLISGRMRSDVPQPLQAQLAILQAGPAEGRTAEELAKERLQEVVAQGIALKWAAFMLGGEAGLMVDGAPEDETTARQGFVVHGDTLYILTLSPVAAENPQGTREALDLWEIAIASFAFLD